MSKRRSLEVTAEQCSQFLKRPTPKVQDLNINLRKSYGRHFFKASNFTSIRQKVKQLKSQQSDSANEVKIEEDSDFSMKKSKKVWPKRVTKQLDNFRSRAQAQKPAEKQLSSSLSSSSSSESQTQSLNKQKRSSKKMWSDQQDKPQQVVYQGHVDSKQSQNEEEEGEEKQVIQISGQKEVEEIEHSPQKEVEEILPDTQKQVVPEQHRASPIFLKKLIAKVKREEMRNKNNQAQNARQQSKNSEECRQQSVVLQISPKEVAIKSTKLPQQLRLLQQLNNSTSKENNDFANQTTRRRPRITFQRQIAVKLQEQPKEQTPPKRASKIEPTKVSITLTEGLPAQKGVIYEAPASKRVHRMELCPKIIVQSLYVRTKIVTQPSTSLNGSSPQQAHKQPTTRHQSKPEVNADKPKNKGVILRKRVKELSIEPPKKSNKSQKKRSIPVARLPSKRKRSQRHR